MPKTNASGATIGVDPRVNPAIHQLKGREVTINWGGKGARKHSSWFAPMPLTISSSSPFETGGPMSDHNILTRHIKPAARKLGLAL